MLTSDEKKYLRELVKKELDAFKKEQRTLFIDIAVPFIKAEHDYGHFLEGLLKKLK